MGATEAKPEVTTKTSPQLLINWLTEEVQTGKKGTPILTKQLQDKKFAPSNRCSTFSLSRGKHLKWTMAIESLCKAGSESLKSYLWDRRSRAPLKKCGMLKLDSSVHRLDSDIVSRSCHTGRCELDFWRAGEKKRQLSGLRRRWPPKQFWPVLLQQPSWGPTFLCIGTSAGSWGIKTLA